MALVIVDSFLLRGVEPPKIYEKLQAGAYRDVHLPEEKIEIVGGEKASGREVEKRRENVLVYWSNKDVARMLGISRAPGNFCDWCRRKIRVVDGVRQAMGMPISAPKNGELPQVGTYDTWNCMYSDSLREESMPAGLHSPLYDESRVIVQKVFRELYPDGKLSHAPHWSKLRCNGGYMTDKEYDEKLIYVGKMEHYRPLACVVVDQLPNI